MVDLLALAAAEGRRARRALERLRKLDPRQRRLLAANSPALSSSRAAFLVLEEARRCRRPSPAQALQWAEIAVELAERSEGPLAGDALAEAWAEVGNAHRMTGTWDLAEQAFRRARRALEGSSGDPEVFATVASLWASLDLARERPGAAAEALTAVLPTVVASGQHGLAVKLLIKLAIACSIAQDPGAGLDALERAWLILPDDVDPSVRVSLAHESMALALQAGDPQRALEYYRSARPTLRRHGTRVDRARGRWIAGRAMAETGSTEEAALFLELARETFEDQGRSWEVALVAVDQALVELERCPERAQAMATEAAGLLTGLGLRQAALAALQIAIAGEGCSGLRPALEALRRAHAAPSAGSRI